MDIKDYFNLEIWTAKNEFGVRIGHPVLTHEIANIPTIYETNTRYNKRKFYDFSYKGLNFDTTEIDMKGHFNVRKNESFPGGGTYQTFNQTWEAWLGVKIGVENETFTYHARVKKTDSDFPGGILGWIVGLLDIEYRILGYLIEQKDPGKFSDAILTIAASIITGQQSEMIRMQNDCINEFIKQRILTPLDVRFDEKGVWFIFKYQQPHVQQIINLINSGSCS